MTASQRLAFPLRSGRNVHHGAIPLTTSEPRSCYFPNIQEGHLVSKQVGVLVDLDRLQGLLFNTSATTPSRLWAFTSP
jgi:hypothetical protein